MDLLHWQTLLELIIPCVASLRPDNRLQDVIRTKVVSGLKLQHLHEMDARPVDAALDCPDGNPADPSRFLVGQSLRSH
jgi:hypothetical protein